MTFLAAVSILILDRLTKFIALKNLAQGQSIKILQDIFHFTLVFNDGTAFGLWPGKTGFFILLSLAVIVFIIAFTRRKKFKDVILSASLGLILGGAIGNLIDRMTFGYVIDFLDFRVWPVFNVADSAITVGTVIIAWKLLVSRKVSR